MNISYLVLHLFLVIILSHTVRTRAIKRHKERLCVCVCVFVHTWVKGSRSHPRESRASFSSQLAERKCSSLISYQMIPIEPDQ